MKVKNCPETFKPNCGVKQGGILSGYLFNIFMRPLVKKLNGNVIQQTIDYSNIMYADDLVMFTPSVNGMSQMLKDCEDFAIENGLKWNPIKSKVMSFGVRSPKIFILCNESIEFVDSFKYLGFQLTKKKDLVCDNDQLFGEARRIYKYTNIMMAAKMNKLSYDVKISLIKTFGNISFMECFNDYSNQAFRKVTGAHRYMVMRLLKFRNLQNEFNLPDGSWMGEKYDSCRANLFDVRSRWLFSPNNLSSMSEKIRHRQYKYANSLANRTI